MTNPQNHEELEDGAAARLTETLIVALARVRLIRPDATPEGPAPVPPEVVAAVATFVGTLRGAGVSPERMLVAFKKVLKSIDPRGGWQGHSVERAMVDAAIASYFNRDPVSAAASGTSHIASRGRRSVLIVDDNEDSRFILGVMLQGEGIDTFVASGGVEALLIARQAEVALILMDLAMPRIDGRETLLLLRQLASIRTTPVVAITAFPPLAQAPDLLSVGFAEVLMKPIGPGDLRRTVQRYCPDLLQRSELS